MASVRSLQTGFVKVAPAVPDARASISPLAYTGLFQKRGDRVMLPVKAFLLDIAGRLTLIDTGWSTEAATNARTHLGLPLWYSSTPELKPSESVIHQLAKHNIAVRDLDAIVMTHLDCDHASGLGDLREAKRIIVAPQELLDADGADPRYRSFLWNEIDFEEASFTFDEAAPFGQSFDLYGDGTVVAYLIPGHSRGSMVVIARDNTTGAFAAIVGDTGYNTASWNELALPGVIYDEDAFRKGLTWVRTLSESDDCIGIFAAHDPATPPGVYTF